MQQVTLQTHAELMMRATTTFAGANGRQAPQGERRGGGQAKAHEDVGAPPPALADLLQLPQRPERLVQAYLLRKARCTS
jgi:hypothetical protein